LANLEERSTHGNLDCFLGVEDKSLNEDSLVNKATGNIFALSWKTIALPVVEALPYFWK